MLWAWSSQTSARDETPLLQNCSIRNNNNNNKNQNAIVYWRSFFVLIKIFIEISQISSRNSFCKIRGGGASKRSTRELPLLVCGRLICDKHIPRDKSNLLEKWTKDRCVGLCLWRETLEEKKKKIHVSKQSTTLKEKKRKKKNCKIRKLSKTLSFQSKTPVA